MVVQMIWWYVWQRGWSLKEPDGWFVCFWVFSDRKQPQDINIYVFTFQGFLECIFDPKLPIVLIHFLLDIISTHLLGKKLQWCIKIKGDFSNKFKWKRNKNSKNLFLMLANNISGLENTRNPRTAFQGSQHILQAAGTPVILGPSGSQRSLH